MKARTWMNRVARFFPLFLALSLLPAANALADAEATYKAKCAGCHGPDGKGNTPAGKMMGTHDFASPEVQKMSDADLTSIISMGKNKMPSYAKSLKDAEIKDLVSYIRVFGKK